jgi:hypothetical protein
LVDTARVVVERFVVVLQAKGLLLAPWGSREPVGVDIVVKRA